MEPHEAGCLLEMLSGFNDPKMEKEVARVLDYQTTNHLHWQALPPM